MKNARLSNPRTFCTATKRDLCVSVETLALSLCEKRETFKTLALSLCEKRETGKTLALSLCEKRETLCLLGFLVSQSGFLFGLWLFVRSGYSLSISESVYALSLINFAFWLVGSSSF